jgi:hypothetical protein
VPVHADAPPIMDVVFIEEHDPHVNPLGVKGVGEIGMVGVAPAITNAIFHATGRRIRELPVTPARYRSHAAWYRAADAHWPKCLRGRAASLMGAENIHGLTALARRIGLCRVQGVAAA